MLAAKKLEVTHGQQRELRCGSVRQALDHELELAIGQLRCTEEKSSWLGTLAEPSPIAGHPGHALEDARSCAIDFS